MLYLVKHCSRSFSTKSLTYITGGDGWVSAGGPLVDLPRDPSSSYRAVNSQVSVDDLDAVVGVELFRRVVAEQPPLDALLEAVVVDVLHLERVLQDVGSVQTWNRWVPLKFLPRMNYILQYKNSKEDRMSWNGFKMLDQVWLLIFRQSYNDSWDRRKKLALL